MNLYRLQEEQLERLIPSRYMAERGTRFIQNIKTYLKALQRDYTIYLALRDLRNQIDPILPYLNE
jgi:hypothetical protein